VLVTCRLMIAFHEYSFGDPSQAFDSKAMRTTAPGVPFPSNDRGAGDRTAGRLLYRQIHRWRLHLQLHS